MTQQICDRLRDFETDNTMLLQAVDAVYQARQKEDTAFKRFSGKDFASDDLKREDALEDKYMSTVHNVLNGLLYLPDTIAHAGPDTNARPNSRSDTDTRPQRWR